MRDAACSVDELVSAQTDAQASFARTVGASCSFVEASSRRPQHLAPGAVFDCDAAEASAIAQVASALAVSTATVTEWLFLVRTALPAVQEAFDAGRLAYSAFRTVCRALSGVPNATEELLQRVIGAAGRCTPKAVASAIDRILAEFDSAWHRKMREQADKERAMAVRKLPRGQAEIKLRGPAVKVAAMQRAIVETAGQVCVGDPREVSVRLFDAAHAVTTGTPMTCQCSNPECRFRSTPARSSAHAYIVISAETAAGLSGDPGHLVGWGDVPADVARRIAADATWQAIITQARPVGGRRCVCRCPQHDPPDPPDDDPPDDGPPGGGPPGPPGGGPQNSDPPVTPETSVTPSPPDAPVPTEHREARRTRPMRAGWTPDDGELTSTRAQRIRRKVEELRRLPPPALEHAVTHPDGHGGFDAPPSGALTYRPSQAVSALIRARYQSCVHPGCAVPSSDCDLDHVIPFDRKNPDQGGWTITTNLEPLCRRHHGLKTKKQWQYRMLQDGIVHIRDPHGHDYLTAPGE